MKFSGILYLRSRIFVALLCGSQLAQATKKIPAANEAAAGCDQLLSVTMKQFDRHADAYQTIREKITYPTRLYEILAQASPSKSAALDIGCGNGVSTIRLKPYFDYVEGTDLSTNLIEKAKATYPGLNFSAIASENYSSSKTFDLVTSATSFYWMDRDLVLQKVADLLAPNGVFCAYKYDFPIVYGPLRNLIENELVTRWARTRDPRLTSYDDTLEKIKLSKRFKDAERIVIPNIIELSPKEVALFFLSTSYVTRYIEEEGGPGYAQDFLQRVIHSDPSPSIHVNFDIHAFWAKKDR